MEAGQGVSQSEPETSRKWWRRGLWAAWVITGAGIGLFAVSIPFVLPALRRYCLPYIPATPVQVEKILHQLKGRQGKVVDLGSGDGRVVSMLGVYLFVSTQSLINNLVPTLLGNSFCKRGSLCRWI